MSEEKKLGPNDQSYEKLAEDRGIIIDEILKSNFTRVRAKFTVNSYETSLQSGCRDPKTGGYLPPVECRTVKLTAVADGSEENKRFFKWTPSGQISLGVLNPEAWKQLELGKSYYVDFSPAP